MKSMHKLGGLPHIEVSDEISEAALKTDNRLEKRWPDAKQCDKSRPNVACAKHTRIPLDRAMIEHQRGVAEGLCAAGKDEIHRTFADVSISRVNRLHAGPAIDLRRECRHCLTHAKTQCRDTPGFISSAITLTQPRMT